MNTYISRLRYFVSCLVPACAVFAFTDASAAPTSSNTAGKVPPYGADLTANETKAVTLIRTATEVDLADVKQFASRELSGHFIRRLLLDEAGIARKQIVISNAVIADELNCFMETITVQAVFKKCHFQGVQFGQVTFEKSIAFSECSFAGPANFEEVIAEKNFAINLSTFSEKASFGYARIKGNFSTLQATFLHETEAAVFGRLRIEGDAFFDKAEFSGPVVFSGLHVSGICSLSGAKFLNSKYPVIMSYLKLDSDFLMADAEFHCPLQIRSSDISGDVVISSKFLYDSEGV